MILSLLLGFQGVQALPVSQSAAYFQGEEAVLRGLDKITGRSTDFTIRTGEPMVYGSLLIDMEVCYKTPPEQPPESAAFLQIEPASDVISSTRPVPRKLSEFSLTRARPEEGRNFMFSGWMFASSPGLNALENPVYDVWVINCKAEIPDDRDLFAMDDDEDEFEFFGEDGAPADGDTEDDPSDEGSLDGFFSDQE